MVGQELIKIPCMYVPTTSTYVVLINTNVDYGRRANNLPSARSLNAPSPTQ